MDKNEKLINKVENINKIDGLLNYENEKKTKNIKNENRDLENKTKKLEAKKEKIKKNKKSPRTLWIRRKKKAA